MSSQALKINVLSTDRKSTRLNSSHLVISYAVFCLKKKKKQLVIYPPLGTLASASMQRTETAVRAALDLRESAKTPTRVFLFFFNDRAPSEIYPLPLHDALPISKAVMPGSGPPILADDEDLPAPPRQARRDRKSTRLNSSHLVISYAVFFLK